MRHWIRRAGLACMCAALLGAGPRVLGDEAADEGEATLAQRVETAIQRGSDWLLDRHLGRGTFVAKPGLKRQMPLGENLLASWALVRSRPNDLKLQRECLTCVKRGYNGSLLVYEATLCMLILEHCQDRNREDESKEARRIGVWMSRWKDTCVRHCVSFIPKTCNELSADAPPSTRLGYALRGLHAASRLGGKVEPSVVMDLADKLMVIQQAEGASAPRRDGSSTDGTPEVLDRCRGFAYARGAPAVSGTTACGLLGACATLAILPEAPAAFRGRAAASQWDAVAWLGSPFRADVEQIEVYGHKIGGESAWEGFYLYTLSEAARLAGLMTIGGHDWYTEGAQFLVDDQQEQGEWTFSGWEHFRDTCFALLFLRSGPATVTKETPPKMKSETTPR